MLTLPEEVKLVWLGRPSTVKALFLFNRYFVPLFIAIDLATLSGALHMTDQVGLIPTFAAESNKLDVALSYLDHS